MSDRITKARAQSALEHYLRACHAVGLTEEQTAGACIDAPYGQALYVVRYSADNAAGRFVPIHDLPGFVGSGGSGSSTLRDVHTKLLQTASALYDLADLNRSAR
jgi:hypothetical protein